MTIVAIRNRGSHQVCRPGRASWSRSAKKCATAVAVRMENMWGSARAQSHRARRVIEAGRMIARPDPGPGTEQPAPGEVRIELQRSVDAACPHFRYRRPRRPVQFAGRLRHRVVAPERRRWPARETFRLDEFSGLGGRPSRSPCAASSSGQPVVGAAKSGWARLRVETAPALGIPLAGPEVNGGERAQIKIVGVKAIGRLASARSISDCSILALSRRRCSRPDPATRKRHRESRRSGRPIYAWRLSYRSTGR